uniref:Protein E7 n=1 Tax=Bat papillomavirus TaxID=2004707 RepID=A0A2Z2JLZ2_9PAPI|nr:E7 [Bat papillomavirus]
MRVGLPSLQELVSQETAEVVDLNCYEIMSSDEEEEVEEVDPLPLFVVAVKCGVCDRHVRLFCGATRETLRFIEISVLEGVLSFLCPSCGLAGEDGG